jgi:serine/threonine protein kinase
MTRVRLKTDTKLGRGGQKTVKTAINLETGEKHAVAITRNSRLRKCAKAESDTMQLLSDSNEVVKLNAYAEGETKSYMVMEYCNQGDLYSAIKTPTLNHSQRLQIARDAAQGVLALHNKHKVHRDIKLENILLTNNRAKLADFGHTCNQDDESKATLNYGTTIYCSPERAKILITRDNRLLPKPSEDVWAFGALMYELFHPDSNTRWLKKPQNYNNRDPIGKIADITQEEINQYCDEELRGTCPPALVDLIQSMLNIDPSKRPPMEVVVQCLNEIA